MIGIIAFVIALFAMFGWFIYLFVKDPANIYKRRPPADPQSSDRGGSDRSGDPG
jgi:hypothetical protein